MARRIRWTVLAVASLSLAACYAQGAMTPREPLTFAPLPDTAAPAFPDRLASLTNSVVTTGRVTGLWSAPDAYYEQRLAAIRQAQHTIRFETFFMTPGARAADFGAALSERARAGVQVQVLVDAAGVSLPEAYWQSLRDAGAEVRFYHPFEWRSPLRYNARTHRKMLLIDGKVAFSGGPGVSDDWDGTPKDKGAWLDLEARLEGPVVATLSGVFMQHWSALGGKIELPQAAPAPGAQDAVVPASVDRPIVVTAGNPSADESSIRLLFQATLRAARRRLWIASPYFLPDADARRALVEAHQRGVDVKVLTEGPRNDKAMAYMAMREQYGELLTSGVEIHEFQPAFMHAKAMVIDDGWVSFGSTNFDPRSLYHNDEMNFGVSDQQLAARMATFFTEAFAKSRRVESDRWAERPWSERAQGQLARVFKFQL